MRHGLEIELGTQQNIVLDTNVVINAVLENKPCASLDILRLVELGKIAICTIPSILREIRFKLKEFSSDSVPGRINWISNVLDKAIDLSPAPYVDIPVEPDDPADRKFLVAQQKLLTVLRARTEQPVVGDGLLVSADWKHLGNLHLRYPEMTGLVIDPKRFRDLIGH